jgi:glycosyltransferase involved in cell wall biosynthesis
LLRCSRAVGSTTATPRISVVMPTYNRGDRLAPVVAALLADPGTTELITVVDGCRDGSLELLETIAAADPRLRPLWIDNRGENGAREAGIRAASHPIVLLIDDDVLAGPGLVSGHARHHAGRDDLVVVGYMPVTEVAQKRGGAPARLYAAWYEGQCRQYEAAPDRVLQNLWAGNLSLGRERALTVGLHNPAFDARYNPDRDLGLRLAAAGLTGRFDRALAAEHLYERSLDAFLRDAAATGEGTWLVHRLHADAVGPLPQDAYLRTCSPRTRPAVRFARRPRSGPAIRAAVALARAACSAGVRRIDERAASVAFAMIQQRAALERDRREAVSPA